jgi:peroxiredoxin
LPYPLLSDWHKQTVKAYQVFDYEKETAIRSVFLVNREGVITYVNTAFDARNPEHYQLVFRELEKLK